MQAKQIAKSLANTVPAITDSGSYLNDGIEFCVVGPRHSEDHVTVHTVDGLDQIVHSSKMRNYFNVRPSDFVMCEIGSIL